MNNTIEEVKKKREYSQLPDSIVQEALQKTHYDIKEARAFLRKYFGVFLTNKVIKGKGTAEEQLQAHKSSQKRNYQHFYQQIKEQIPTTKSIIDLGAGANGYSYPLLQQFFGEINYLGIEAAGQLVHNTNQFYKQQHLTKAHLIQEDLHQTTKILEEIKKQPKPRTILLLQVIDALEGIKNNYSKTLIKELAQESEYQVISLPTETLGAQKKFRVNREWFTSFIKEHLTIIKEWEEAGEKIFITQKHK